VLPVAKRTHGSSQVRRTAPGESWFSCLWIVSDRLPKFAATWQNQKLSFRILGEDSMDRLDAMSTFLVVVEAGNRLNSSSGISTLSVVPSSRSFKTPQTLAYSTMCWIISPRRSQNRLIGRPAKTTRAHRPRRRQPCSKHRPFPIPLGRIVCRTHCPYLSGARPAQTKKNPPSTRPGGRFSERYVALSG
jgi:hypothetical protein